MIKQLMVEIINKINNDEIIKEEIINDEIINVWNLKIEKETL